MSFIWSLVWLKHSDFSIFFKDWSHLLWSILITALPGMCSSISVWLPVQMFKHHQSLDLSDRNFLWRCEFEHRLCHLLALEGTRASSVPTHPSTCRTCVGEDTLLMCRVLITLSKSLFLPLLTHSTTKIRPPSASSHELFSSEKVSWRKTPPHLALLRHLWPSVPMTNVHMCFFVFMHNRIWQESRFYIAPLSIPTKTYKNILLMHFSLSLFVNEINRPGYHILFLSLHICHNRTLFWAQTTMSICNDTCSQ